MSGHTTAQPISLSRARGSRHLGVSVVSETLASVANWSEFHRSSPDLADTGRALLYQVGVGLGFLATVRRDGGPRVHPICPLLLPDDPVGTELYAFIVPGPKQDDLHRDGRYSLHSFPCEDNEDAFYCTGRAEDVADAGIRRALSDLFVAERSKFDVAAPDADAHLFRFGLDRVLVTRTVGHGDPDPQHTTWRAPTGSQGPKS
ncbi:hypothetical protein DFR76_1193 [Nocardia pseudobrasiliensis]|uniref:Pyridoxamine 5'-phosphate oxidase n=1 Tax=Nocardia pseudobrasiliensis TaxID=45979 RepID=A0A370HKB0_9NOCA|nr:hypothetical protein DFR76_1193 [Nocardia pseudobrasiliensis]